MKILILTSKDHIYANFLLQQLFRSGIFSGHRVMVWEQDTIVPGRSKTSGLFKYVHRAGLGYVSAQVMKQILFFLLRSWVSLTRKRESVYYPYWQSLRIHVLREVYNGIKSDAAFKRVKYFGPDLILSVFSKEIIPDRILKIPTKGAYNLHPALLPHYRGVSPIFWAMAEGAKRVGITLHVLDTGIDTGTIISQKAIVIHRGESEHGVYMRLTAEGIKLLISFLAKVFNRSHVSVIDKRGKKSTTYYSLPTKEAVGRLYTHGYAIFRLRELLFSKLPIGE